MYRMNDLNDVHGDVKAIIAVTAVVAAPKEVGIIQFGPDSSLADNLLDRLMTDVARFPFIDTAATLTDFFGKERIALAFPVEAESEATEPAAEDDAAAEGQTDQQAGGEADEWTGPKHSRAYAVLVDGEVAHLFLVTDEVVVVDGASDEPTNFDSFVFGFTDEELSDGAQSLSAALRAVTADDYLYRFAEGAQHAEPEIALNVFNPADTAHDSAFDHEGVTFSVISFCYE
jgi:hypothetical protein